MNFEELKDLFTEKLRDYVLEERNKICRCPVCNSKISDRIISLYSGLINTLYKVYCWCGEKRRHEFENKDVQHFFNKNDYARFGDLIRFGGLVYKPENKKGSYGINMSRAKEFFEGKRKIPVQIVLNQITNEIVAATYVYVYDFPNILELLNKDGLYDYEKVIYVKPDYELQKKRNLSTVGEYKENSLF
jgi:hypothetical protein